MSLHDVSDQEKLELLEAWKNAVQGDIDEYQALVDEQVKKKQIIEERVAKKLRPILNKINTFQKFVDNFTLKMNKINEQIKKIKKDLEKS